MDAVSLQELVTNLTNILVAVAGFFIVRTLRQVDSSLRELRQGYDNHGTRIARLEGFQDGLRLGRQRAEENAA